MAKVEWTIKAIKQLKKIDSRYRKIVTEKGNALSNFPNVDMDIVRLTDRKDEYRMRIGNYRILFSVFNDMPIVISISQVIRRQSKTY